MKKPLALKLIIALTFLAPLSSYAMGGKDHPLALAVITMITTPIAVGLHQLRPKARIAMLVILDAMLLLEVVATLAAPPSARPLFTVITAQYALASWYMHRSATRLLFHPQ